MNNFSLIATLSNGTVLDHYFGDCQDLLKWLAGFDIVPDMTSAEIVVTTDDGKVVHITIPNDHSHQVRTTIEGGAS